MSAFVFLDLGFDLGLRKLEQGWEASNKIPIARATVSPR